MKLLLEDSLFLFEHLFEASLADGGLGAGFGEVEFLNLNWFECGFLIGVGLEFCVACWASHDLVHVVEALHPLRTSLLSFSLFELLF